MTDTTQMGTRDDARKGEAGELADEAFRVADDLRDEAEERADRWTGHMGKRGAGLARALGAASTSLREDGDEKMADLADRAAEQVERMAGYLERENPGALMDDLEELGRSNPTAFLGTAFAAGVLSGRLFRASAPDNGNARASGNGHGDAGTSESRGTSGTDPDGKDRQDRQGGQKRWSSETARSGGPSTRNPSAHDGGGFG